MEKILENDLDKEKESWGRLRLGNRNKKRVRFEYYYYYYYFFKKSLLLTVDVNTVCVEGLNWSFFISCGCVWYCLKSEGSFLKFIHNIIIAAYFTIFEEGYSYKLFCKFFYKLIIWLMIIDKFKKKNVRSRVR